MPPPPSLLRQLGDPATVEAAAAAMLVDPDWLTGPPPPALLAALADPASPLSGPFIRLLHAWSRPHLVPALLAALPAEDDVERRRRLAWTLKQVSTEEAVAPLLEIATSPDEDALVRLSAIEAVTGCSFADEDGWTPTEPAARLLLADPDPRIRSAATALVGFGEGHQAARRAAVIPMLGDPDPTVVVTALTALRPARLAPGDVDADLRERLLHHPNPHIHLTMQHLLASAEGGAEP